MTLSDKVFYVLCRYTVKVMEKEFGKNSTLRLSCRKGDYLMWCSKRGGIFGKRDNYNIDVWQLKDGDCVTITNRQCDLPDWFELHFREVRNRLALRMKEKMEMDKGYWPDKYAESSNLWKVMAGDRLIWTGKKREGIEYEDGVLGIFTFSENAAVIGEPFSITENYLNFGDIDIAIQTPEESEQCRKGYAAMLNLPEQRTYYENDRWTIEWV